MTPTGTFHTEDLKALLASRLQPFANNPHGLTMQIAEHDARILALTMMGEGRGETVDGRIAIAWTARNRSLQKGQTVAARCLQKAQYSCWWPTDGEENYRALMVMAEAVFLDKEMDRVTREIYQECVVLAGGVLDGRLRDRTHGSCHYITTKLLMAHPPKWVDRPAAAVIGNHAFFAGIPWS